MGKVLKKNARRILDVNPPLILNDGFQPAAIHPRGSNSFPCDRMDPSLVHQPTHKVLHIGRKVSAQAELANGQPQEVPVGDWVVLLQDLFQFLDHDFPAVEKERGGRG